MVKISLTEAECNAVMSLLSRGLDATRDYPGSTDGEEHAYIQIMMMLRRTVRLSDAKTPTISSLADLV